MSSSKPKIRVLTFLGTRPEAIKLAPVIAALGANASFESLICSTGQHREMLAQALAVFDVEPNFDLALMVPGQSLADLNGRAVAACANLIRQVKPNVVIVHGDTTTALSAAIAAFYEGIPVGHVEAGLRTYDLASPFPEEFNRQVISKLAQWHFAPTDKARNNLLAETVDSSKIYLVGNTVVDALQAVTAKLDTETQFESEVLSEIIRLTPNAISAKRLILVTAHRRENLDGGISNICEAIKRLALEHSDLHFVFPVHLNPAVQLTVRELLSGLENVDLIQPIPYELAVWYMFHADLIVTDSGGMQEEGAGLGKRVIVTRQKTEREEGVSTGHLVIAGTQAKDIVASVNSSLEQLRLGTMNLGTNPYGDGMASTRIVDAIEKSFSEE